MNIIKRIAALALAGVLALSLAACGSSKKEEMMDAVKEAVDSIDVESFGEQFNQTFGENK